MIERKNSINPQAEIVQITFSYSRADIKRWVRVYVRELCAPDGLREDEASRTAVTEVDFTRWLRSHPAAFYALEQPWAGQLARWAFVQAVKLGYLAEVEDKPGNYCLTAKSLKLQ
jgi:hypothetical protein